ncbi:hypothetical protein [Tenacibaculum maritimum]|uniref:hypothetical protein n=1 Tax=Tenacibaculum maritimum TaxID=107401 RepID=UPI00040B7735|nr:hypothetical protein [Tenacibaculum maritimum]MDB0599816.1 hypothetical protein [Tenacibaculum maritimum]MDB0610926.1 hypothetical protein [Tenacibaculum maritimum]CAA0245462.1 hypothetical protein TFA04_650005 [Tenacibaculum maritimum]CAA0248082.1 hypothetical protein TMP248_60133 [Tenacibaculum maritimum]
MTTNSHNESILKVGDILFFKNLQELQEFSEKHPPKDNEFKVEVAINGFKITKKQ